MMTTSINIGDYNHITKEQWNREVQPMLDVLFRMLDERENRIRQLNKNIVYWRSKYHEIKNESI
jgi:hypothetical protein